MHPRPISARPALVAMVERKHGTPRFQPPQTLAVGHESATTARGEEGARQRSGAFASHQLGPVDCAAAHTCTSVLLSSRLLSSRPMSPPPSTATTPLQGPSAAMRLSAVRRSDAPCPVRPKKGAPRPCTLRLSLPHPSSAHAPRPTIPVAKTAPLSGSRTGGQRAGSHG